MERGDLDIFILSERDANACIGAGDEGTYTLIVDADCGGAANIPSITENRQIAATIQQEVKVHPNPFQEQTMIMYPSAEP